MYVISLCSLYNVQIAFSYVRYFSLFFIRRVKHFHRPVRYFLVLLYIICLASPYARYFLVLQLKCI